MTTSLASYVSVLAYGFCNTLVIWAVTVCMSFVVGTIAGICTHARVAPRLVRNIVRSYAFVAKGIPAYVQILIAYFVVPALFHISISPFVAAAGALIFCSSGYVIEIIRSGLRSIPDGQWEAAYVLGYTKKTTILRIIGPQLFRVVLPALIGEAEQLLKSSALCATIGIVELTRAGMNIISRELNPIPVYCVVASLYLMVSAVLQILLFAVERRIRYGTR